MSYGDSLVMTTGNCFLTRWQSQTRETKRIINDLKTQRVSVRQTTTRRENFSMSERLKKKTLDNNLTLSILTLHWFTDFESHPRRTERSRKPKTPVTKPTGLRKTNKESMISTQEPTSKIFHVSEHIKGLRPRNIRSHIRRSQKQQGIEVIVTVFIIHLTTNVLES